MLHTPTAGAPGARPPSILTPEKARKAVTQILADKLRRNLVEFCKRAWVQLLPEPPIWNWHADALCDHLSFVTMGEIRFLMINVPPRHSKPCWEDEFVVEKDRGSIALKEIKRGDLILTHRGRFRRVRKVHRQGILPTVRISTARGRSLVVAPDHPLLTTNGWKNAGDLIVGDILAVVRPQESSGSATVTAEEARLLGYLIGDGSLLYNIAFTNSDPLTLDDFESCAAACGFITRRTRTRSTWTVKLKSKRHGTRWKSGDVGAVRQWLRGFGLDRTSSYTKHVPTRIFGANEELIAQFVGAYWACDGFIAKRGCARNGTVRTDSHVGCDSVSETLIRGMQRLLSRLGINGHVRRKVANLKTAKQPNGYVSWALHITNMDAVARFGAAVPIAHAKGKLLRRSRADFDRLYDDDTVTAVEPHLPLPCRCLTVDEDSSFTAQDLAVHNTMLASVLWPVWHWLHKPGEQFLTGSVDDTLATDASILSRRLMESEWFQTLYPGELELYSDENRAGMFRNTKGGYRQTASMQGRITGVGGTIQLLDDPHDAKKVESDVVRLGAIATHDNAWRSRLNNPNKAQKVYIGQRTHDNDIFGHVLEQEGQRWVNLILAEEFNPSRRCITYFNDGHGPKLDKKIFEDPRTLENELLDPKRFSKETAENEKGIMSERAWEAQYNQNPVGTGGLILKRHWWRSWVQPDWRPNANTERPMPVFSEIIQVYDTAFEEDEEADFTCRTTWGMFTHQEVFMDQRTRKPIQGKTRTCMMLLDSMLEKLAYPELREEAIKGNDEFAPDKILVEKKASGHSLIQELRKKHLPVVAVKLAGSSGRGRGQGDLIARAHEASLMLERGCVWYPPRRFALEVIEKSSKFPNGPPGSRDIVSTLVIAFQYARRFLDLEFPDDEKDEISPWAWRKSPRKRYA